ncbi:phosphoribosylanthranilate isomerase [Natranaerovirga pectinivora]|uniref:N-(5'-phosphoribosyl)anthranilate isomerase n=1 Tax=Natranaerovirga pectinivora TaxID=682400 RepID=A0A4R3MP67_9FIRM|nr:phosphoribosylanthranilate isomerase [Natranaerovirga pectinivora]TCT17085.1 phosphoribosylanthranilate isomerase [Natranaerovirga pectinivora]
MNPKIKICGITKKEEIPVLNEFNIDYVGFVFAKSKREVSVKDSMNLRANLNNNIKTVAVVKEPPIELLEEILQGGFDILQWHGSLKEETIKHINMPIWQAISVKDKESLGNIIYDEKIIGYVFDGSAPGSGKPFDWQVLSDIQINSELILAGGLDSDNIIEAINKIKPTIVDVSSGVESDKGKDPYKIKEFVRKVKNYGNEQ